MSELSAIQLVLAEMRAEGMKDGGMIEQAQRDYKGSYIEGSLGGVKVSNPSLRKYYKGML